MHRGLHQGEWRVDQAEDDARQEDGVKPRLGEVQQGRQKQNAADDFFSGGGHDQNDDRDDQAANWRNLEHGRAVGEFRVTHHCGEAEGRRAHQA
ncbi:hypothetical protein D3C80_1396620 [compost metagenome]